MKAPGWEKKFRALEGKLLIGLTGPIASGKSLALAAFREAGALAVSADAVAAEVLTSPPCYNRILRKFGRKAILTNGSLDKERLAALIFRRPAARKWLESQLHPEILRRIHSLIEKSGKKIAVVEAPLLFEAGLAGCFDVTLCLYAPEAALRRRALGRGWTAAQYEARRKAQYSAGKKRSLADLTLDNSGTEADLRRTIKRICRFLTGRRER